MRPRRVRPRLMRFRETGRFWCCAYCNETGTRHDDCGLPMRRIAASTCSSSRKWAFKFCTMSFRPWGVPLCISMPPPRIRQDPFHVEPERYSEIWRQIPFASGYTRSPLARSVERVTISRKWRAFLLEDLNKAPRKKNGISRKPSDLSRSNRRVRFIVMIMSHVVQKKIW